MPKHSFSLNTFGSLLLMSRFGRLLMFLRVLSAFLPMASATNEEREELKHVMEGLCGHAEQCSPSETYSATLPLDSPLPNPVVFPDHSFIITGRFAYGTRRKVFDAISDLGGFANDSPPTRDTNYLVIGTFASRDWANTNYGRKIEHAVELRESGSGISIISEEHWKRFV